MAHIQRDRRRLVARVNRMIGQLEAVKELLDREDEDGSHDRCYEVMRQLASIKGAHRGLMTTYLQGFVEDHARRAAEEGTVDEFTDELLDVVRSFGS